MLVIFDLDGTLIDTLEDLTDGVNFVLNKNGFKERTIFHIRKNIGYGIRNLINKSLPQEVSSTELNFFVDQFIEHYRKNSIIKTKPYLGLNKVILALKERGDKVAVVTNKNQKSAEHIIEKFFGKNIDRIQGDDKKIKLKPSSDGILAVLKFFNCPNDDAIFIGDTEADIIAGKNAGIKTVAVLWGFRDRTFLQEAGAEFFVANIEELNAMLNL